MVHRHGRHCRFRLIRPAARRAYLVGDFNNWSSTAFAMRRQPAGVWEAALELPPGVYRFRYFVDGRWETDFAAFGIEPNGNGGWDSICYVPESETPGAAAPLNMRDRAVAAMFDH